MLLTGHTKELLRSARDLIKNFKTDPKSLKASVAALELYQKSKPNPVSLRTEAEQELYTHYTMALTLFDFEVNDLIKAIYLLIRSNFTISQSIIQKLSKYIKVGKVFITDESWYMLLSIITCYKNDFEPITVHDIFYAVQKTEPPSSDFCIQALLDLCYLGHYNMIIWKNLLSFKIIKDPKYVEKLRIINYAVKTDARETLTNVIIISIELLLQDCLKAANEQTAVSSKLDLGMLALNKMHREVDFMLKKLMKYEENVNIDDTYIVNFYNRAEGFGLDLSGAVHYFTQDISEKQEALDEFYLVPALRLKSYLLKKNGYKVGRIAFYEWNRYVDQTEKLIFLKRKIRLIKGL